VSLITLIKSGLVHEWALCKECHVYMYVQRRDTNKEIKSKSK